MLELARGIAPRAEGFAEGSVQEVITTAAALIATLEATARDTTDLSGRAMFRFLANMEYQHWMILAQEKDMVVRYPNYGRPGQTPWRAEKTVAPSSKRR